MIDPVRLIRPHLLRIKPYSSARDEFSGEAEIFLDANENPFGSAGGGPWNRYPDPHQLVLKEKISAIRGIETSRIFLGHGSDEPIDLLIRLFCEPGKDKIITFPPTYSMYGITAGIHNVKADEISLTEDFQLDLDLFEEECNDHKMVFICSPNNPSGNLMKRDHVIKVLEQAKGMVVIDEAYIDFCPEASFLSLTSTYPNLVVLQTFSKAWGLAGLRLGAAYAQKEVIDYLDRIKAPYNLSGPIQQQALSALNDRDQVIRWVEEIDKQRIMLIRELSGLSVVRKVYPSDANFLLVKFKGAAKVFSYLKSKNVIVRDRSNMPGCADCLRITVGNDAENVKLINTLKNLAED